MSLSILRKIAVATVNNLPRGGFKDVKERTFVMRVYGVCRKVDTVVTTYGESFKFSGEIRAIGMDGKEHAAPVCYLPAPVDGVLANAVMEADGKNLEFGFDIFIVPDEGSERGYQYRVETLIESAPSDPVTALENNLPKLEIKPATEEKPAEVPEEKPAVENKPQGQQQHHKPGNPNKK